MPEPARRYPEERYREEDAYPEEERYPEERRGYYDRDYRRESRVEEPRPSIYKVSRIINYIFGIIISLILIRLVLKLLGGNPGNLFVAFIYGLTGPLVSPFLTVFNQSFIDTGVGVLELGTIIAILFYLFLNFLIVRLLKIIATRNGYDHDRHR